MSIGQRRDSAETVPSPVDSGGVTVVIPHWVHDSEDHHQKDPNAATEPANHSVADTPVAVVLFLARNRKLVVNWRFVHRGPVLRVGHVLVDYLGEKM